MKRITRSIVFGVLLGAVAAIGFAGTASAQTYPPNAPIITVVAVNGNTANVSGSGWAPGDIVTVIVQSDPIVLGKITVGPAGTFSQNFEIPCSIGNGPHTVTATGSSGTASTGITISGCVVGTGALAFTGSSSSAPFAAAGIGLILVGIVFAVTAQRRRSAHTIKV